MNTVLSDSTTSQVRSDFDRLTLPAAEVRRHLMWRYSIVWRKPIVNPDAAGDVK
jgi:hypothetical protein